VYNEKEYPQTLKKMKANDYSWIWIGALSGLTGGIVSTFYSQWQIDEFNRTREKEYQDMNNGLQTLEASIVNQTKKGRTATKP
jgi:hypothetical protein